MSSAGHNPTRWVTTEEVQAFTEALFDPKRDVPIVAVTTVGDDTRETRVDPEAMAEALGDAAHVVVLATGDPTWDLGERLGKKLGVYGGHLRIWWPGLRRDSNIFDHPLIFIWNREEAERAFDRVQEEVSKFAEENAGTGPARQPREGDDIRGMVDNFEPRGAWVRFGDFKGLVAPGEIVAGAEVDPTEILRVGQHVRARITRVAMPGPRISLSLAQLSLDAWTLFRRRVGVGDVVPGRVREVKNLEVTFDLLPGITGTMGIDRMGPNTVHPGRVFTLDQVVEVEVIAIDPDGKRVSLAVPGPGSSNRRTGHIALLAGGPLFLEPKREAVQPRRALSEDERKLEERLTQVERELEGYVKAHDDLNQQNRTLRDKWRTQKSLIESYEKQIQGFEAQLFGSSDPFESEEKFARAVELFRERTYTVADKTEFPFVRIVVGAKFLASVRDLERKLDRFESLKIVEVCAHVASRRHRAVPGQYVHPLLAGKAGSQTVRERDGAKAWRCALQVNSPSAARLHWWALEGGGVEFASVGVHDDTDIPE